MTAFTGDQLISVAYLVAVVLFILAIKWLSSPVSARRGVLAGEIAAALAVGATLCNPEVRRKWPWRYAPVERNNSMTDSACDVTDATITLPSNPRSSARWRRPAGSIPPPAPPPDLHSRRNNYPWIMSKCPLRGLLIHKLTVS